jgi:hypothetical protein
MRVTPKRLFVILFVGAFFSVQAQTLGDFKPKDEGYKSSKIGDGPKKVYIANFTINFEMYKEAVDKKAAGGFGRTVTSAAKAKAAIGLSSLDKEAIQAKADQLYAEFVADLKSKGYEIISPDLAGKTETYKGWKNAVGPAFYETDMTGILAVIPTGYSFYYRDRNAFSSTLNLFEKTSQNLSKDLDDVLIADVALIYVFSEMGTDWNIGNQANVKIFVNYRLASSYGVSDENTSAGLTSMFDKSKQAVGLSSYVNFTRGKMKIGGNPEAQYIGTLKSDLDIEGVLKKEKVQAYANKTSATATIANPLVSVRGTNYSETTKWLNPDGKLYADGMYLAGNKFISAHLAEAFKN